MARPNPRILAIAGDSTRIFGLKNPQLPRRVTSTGIYMGSLKGAIRVSIGLL